jgi:hydroxypyruvate isomerase
MRFAANLSMLFTETAFLDRFEHAARAGFKAVEFLFPYAHPAKDIRDRLDVQGLELVMHNLPAGDWEAGERGIACLPDRVDEFRDGVHRAIDLHRALVANLRYAAAELRKAGLKLLVEPVNPFDIPGFFVTRSAQAIALRSSGTSGCTAIRDTGGCAPCSSNCFAA